MIKGIIEDHILQEEGDLPYLRVRGAPKGVTCFKQEGDYEVRTSDCNFAFQFSCEYVNVTKERFCTNLTKYLTLSQEI